ncbi:MAG: glutamine--fructose-6-phosphate transaminase (isomerizing) [Patescibacteria group bacterium]|nr:glutamine--fructose-6-phosphate transaminase (isomerizing) [Patescibacteria group bacterium]
MCGIIAYIGDKKASPILVDGLKKLEYRGYDSWGLATVDSGKINFVKSVGRIGQNLEMTNLVGTIGMGHTRWATHGGVTDQNAHPHLDCEGKIAVIHNGIIENFAKLKEQLINEGHKFRSETDTEVLSHLIEKYYEGNLKEAVRRALLCVDGTYGIVVISSKEPDRIVAARHGSPLVVGVGEGENYFASDATALMPYTKKVVFIEENEIVEITKDGFYTITIDDKKVDSKIHEIDWEADLAEKKGFNHFMLKEIFEQPKIMENAFAGRIIPSEGIAHLGGLNLTTEELLKVKRIIFIACGTALHAGLVGKYMIEECASIPCEAECASELRYKRILLDKDTLVFVISQSGETADTIAAMREIQRKGIKVLGISNVVGSTIARETDGGVFVHAGPEIGVASTKAFLAQITVLAILALEFGRVRNLSFMEGKEIASEIKKIPEKIKKILEQNDKIKNLAEKYRDYKNFLYLGRRFNYPLALEGALKMKEISYVHAEGYSAGEMKHGAIAMIDEKFPCVFVAPKDSVYDKTISNMQEIKARSGKIIAVTTEDNYEIEKYVDDVIYIPETLEMLEPLLTVIPIQLLAYHMAEIKGLDVDKPRNLAKSVTVE